MMTLHGEKGLPQTNCHCRQQPQIVSEVSLHFSAERDKGKQCFLIRTSAY